MAVTRARLTDNPKMAKCSLNYLLLHDRNCFQTIYSVVVDSYQDVIRKQNISLFWSIIDYIEKNKFSTYLISLVKVF